ncbi:MAG TPA: type II secretion system protein GspL [Syntrophales bacterium]|nr:type II secretion system protein GspL [Syntrophales bacterium]
MMPEGILGIDIGESALKAVLVSRGMRGGYSVDLAEVIDFGAGGLPEALDKLREKADFRQVQINLSLPVELVSFHNVKLPFRQEKKIRQTIAFELETMLPNGIDDCLLDYNIINQSKNSEILAAVVPRSVVKERISLFGDNPTEIGTIGIGALAVATLLMTRGVFTDTGLLLDLGDRQTVAVFIKGEKIVQVRRYNFGQGSAEREVYEEECKRFCHDLLNTIDFLKWGGIMGDGPSRLVVTGGGSLNAGIKEELARSLSLPPETADLSEICGILLPAGIKEAWAPSVMDRALALAVHRHKKGHGFNFSLRGVESEIKQEKFGKALKWGAVVFSLSILLLAMDSYLDYRYARLRLDNLKKEINALFKASAPEITRIVDPVQQLKVKIADARKISLGLGNIAGGAMVLDILKDISVLTPPLTEFLISSFNLEDDQLLIKGTVKNFDSVDVIKKELAKSNYVKSIQIGNTSMVKQGGKVEFDMKITAQR